MPIQECSEPQANSDVSRKCKSINGVSMYVTMGLDNNDKSTDVNARQKRPLLAVTQNYVRVSMQWGNR